MNPIVLAGVAAALLAAAAVLVLVRPVLGGRMAWPALGAAVCTAVITIVTGWVLGLATLEFLIGIAALALPVLLLLEAAAIASGADRFARWLLMLSWGVVVFPVSALVPLIVTRGCLTGDCGFQDFGAGLPLLVSSSAFVLLAWLPAGVHERAELDRRAGRRAIVAGLVLWVAVAAWLVHLEGTVDEFTSRIAIAAVVGPLAGAIGWLIADQVRALRRPIGRSVMLGLVAGMAATLPGAVSVALPWSAIVGLLAGGIAAVVFSAPGLESTGLATRWGTTLLAAAAIGFIAPAVSGDGSGLIFAARASVLTVPLLVFLAVAAFSLAVSAPVWVLMRRHASRERIPAEILVEE
jgi:Amt family ammonium transporter